MKSFLKVLSLGLVFTLLLSCETNKVEPDDSTLTKDKILVTNPWRLADITDENGKSIPSNQLGFETLAIYLFDIQFFDNNVTKALDRTTKQVVNGGTWYLLENAQILDIEVNQFKGKFGIEVLSRSKMTLSNAVPVNGVSKPAKLVFEPVVL